jgi:hypothetical protein
MNKPENYPFNISANCIDNITLTGIYMIKCKSNNKVYIGSAKAMASTKSKRGSNFLRRWQKHISDLKAIKHRNIKLQRAFDKYGLDAFVFSILEIIPVTESHEYLWEREEFYVNSYNAIKKGFNISDNFIHAINFKKEVSLETREKMRNAMLGKPRPESLKIGLGRPVYQLDTDGNILKEFYSLQSAADSLGLWRQNIRHVCKGRDITAGGYKWQYKDVYDNNTNVK